MQVSMGAVIADVCNYIVFKFRIPQAFNCEISEYNAQIWEYTVKICYTKTACMKSKNYKSEQFLFLTWGCILIALDNSYRPGDICLSYRCFEKRRFVLHCIIG